MCVCGERSLNAWMCICFPGRMKNGLKRHDDVLCVCLTANRCDKASHLFNKQNKKQSIYV